jgi:hypothetical protein
MNKLTHWFNKKIVAGISSIGEFLETIKQPYLDKLEKQKVREQNIKHRIIMEYLDSQENRFNISKSYIDEISRSSKRWDYIPEKELLAFFPEIYDYINETLFKRIRYCIEVYNCDGDNNINPYYWEISLVEITKEAIVLDLVYSDKDESDENPKRLKFPLEVLTSSNFYLTKREEIKRFQKENKQVKAKSND